MECRGAVKAEATTNTKEKKRHLYVEGQWERGGVGVGYLRNKEIYEKKSTRSGKPTIREMKW